MLVECHLAANPQIRRENVGQMFDYASPLWQMGIEDFDAGWQDRNGNSLFPTDGDGAVLHDAIARKSEAGLVRLVLAVDAINEPLKRRMEYLKAMSGSETSISALEYARLAQGSVEMLTAPSYGEELAEAKGATAGRDRTAWDAETNRMWLEANETGSVPNFSAFINEAAALGLEFEGSRSVSPTGGLKIYDAQRRFGTVSTVPFLRARQLG